MSSFDLFVASLREQLLIEPHRVPVVIVSTIGIYVAFMILVKIFGSRVLTSMTASDAVIIIMFGAVAGRVILGHPPTLMTGIIGLTMLMLLEAAFGTMRRYIGWSRYIDRRPVLIMHRGIPVEENMRFSHVSQGDVHSAMRKAGIARAEDVQVMILEPTGQISIVRTGQPLAPEVFADVMGAELLQDDITD